MHKEVVDLDGFYFQYCQWVTEAKLITMLESVFLFLMGMG